MILITKCLETNKEIMSMPATDDNKEIVISTLLENSVNLGFIDVYIETLTEDEYNELKDLEFTIPEGPTEIELMKQDNINLKQQLTLLNTDLQGFMDFYFSQL